MSWRCERIGVAFVSGLASWVSGVSDIDHASPFRKRTFDEDAAIDALVELETVPEEDFGKRAVICFPDSTSLGRFLSSHLVSHSCFANASLATMARRISKLVFTPAICVSARALFALATTSSQLGAVTMIFAIRLSKSVPMIDGCDEIRWVSTLIPFPEGKRNKLILPTLKDQSFDTSSAVIRSWIECSGGGISGSEERFEIEREESGAP